MAKKNYYAVKKGKKPGIYQSWSECSQQVQGFKGAIFKGFETKEEAEQFLGNQEEAITDPEETAVAYVDGSYHHGMRKFSSGVVLFWKGEEMNLSRAYEDPDLVEMRNVAGEIKGSELAITYCLEHNIPSLVIYHDYQGIASWCTGQWQAKKPGTIAYRDFFQEASKKMKIRFCKVKGHSGVEYNEKADQLAKQALGL